MSDKRRVYEVTIRVAEYTKETKPSNNRYELDSVSEIGREIAVLDFKSETAEEAINKATTVLPAL